MLVLLPWGAAAADLEGTESAAVAVACPDPSIAQQLRAELRTMGFRVEAANVDPTPTPEAGLRRMGRERDVAAAVWIRRRDKEVGIWVLDRVTGKVVQRSLDVGRSPPDEVSRTVSLRATELLRASFRELAEGTVPPEATDASEPPPEVAALANEPLRRPVDVQARFFVHIGGGVAIATGGVGPTAQLRVGLRYMPHFNFGVVLDGLIPVVPADIVQPEGSARIMVGMVTVGPHVVLARPSWYVRPDLGLGTGAGFVRMKGQALPPLQGRVDVVTAAALQGRIGVSFLVHTVLHLRLEGTVGTLLPEPVVRFAGREVAAWGQPYGVGLALMEFAIP